VCTKLNHPQLHTLIHPHSWTIDGVPWQEVLRTHARDLNQRLSDEMEKYIAEVEVYLQNRARLDREREARYKQG
jgi:hypothetical protein